MDNPTWIVLLPPILVLVFTAITKRLNLAFILSIIFAALIASAGSFFVAAKLLITRSLDQITDVDYVYLYIFLLVMGIFIVLLDRTGGARAFAHRFTKHIRSAKAAENSSLAVSAVLFIDDYLSNLTVGYVMRPITDKFHIPRAKLAYLVHSISIPLIILMPISSWVAMLTGQLSKAGIMPIMSSQESGVKIIADPFFIFLASIPFIFYSFFALMSVFIIIHKRISFGPMYKHEQIAATTGNLFGNEKELIIKAPVISVQDKTTHPSLLDFCIPLAVLIGTFTLTILYTGNYYLFGGTESFIGAFKNNDQSFLAICLAGLTSLAIALLLALPRKKILIRNLPGIMGEGIEMMLPSVIMLILASILGSLVRLDLHTGSYLAGIIGHAIPASLVPCIFFIIATSMAFLIGTSWGTIAILLPMAIPIITTFAHVSLPTTPAFVPLLFPVLGAIFSGATCGDQLSPISQTSLMASTSSGINPVTHAKTQIPYAIPAIIAALCAFTISGSCALHTMSLLSNCLISLSIGLVVSFVLLITINVIAQHWRRNK